MNRTKRIVVCGICIAIGIVLPLAFHSIPSGGGIFLPMHLPVLLCGLISGPVSGLICGLITPILSCFMTGMPPIALMPGMVFELSVYGFMSGLFYRLIFTKSPILNIYLALLPSMLLGRGMAGFVNGLIFLKGKYTLLSWATASFVTGLPGIAIQLILIPVLVFALQKANLIEVEKRDLWGITYDKLAAKNKKYFNAVANDWNENNVISHDKEKRIIELCRINKGDNVLDIACGTGRIDKLFIEAGASKVTGIDVSDKMIDIARADNNDGNIRYINGDFYKVGICGFDRAVVLNAYPHFTDRRAFVKKLYSCLNEGGHFIIIHSDSPAKINRKHKGDIFKITKELKSATKEESLFESRFEIVEIIDDGDLFMIYGIKKPS